MICPISSYALIKPLQVYITGKSLSPYVTTISYHINQQATWLTVDYSIILFSICMQLQGLLPIYWTQVSFLTCIVQLCRYLISFVTVEPTLPDLLKRFKGVADWNAVCPYLLNDTTGQKTEEIKRNHGDVDGRRTEMLVQYLKESNPTWRDVVSALRNGNYNNLADQIMKDLQG